MKFPSFGLSPAAALVMFQKALSTTIKKPVEKYTLVYTVSSNTLFFLVEGVRIPYNNDKVMYLIKTMTGTHLKEGMVLDLLILKFNEEQNEKALFIYYTKDGQKETIKHLLK